MFPFQNLGTRIYSLKTEFSPNISLPTPHSYFNELVSFPTNSYSFQYFTTQPKSFSNPTKQPKPSSTSHSSFSPRKSGRIRKIQKQKENKKNTKISRFLSM